MPKTRKARDRPTKTDKLLGALSLARRAGALAIGFDAVLDAAARKTAVLVLLAADTSQGTVRRVTAACTGVCPLRRLHLGQAQLARITKKPAGVLAVTNRDFATLCTKAADEEEPD